MKTAVEWFAEMTSKIGYVSADILEQAKEMEKEQIIELVKEIVPAFNEVQARKFAEQYYNETFKTE